jgi:hypothetical protein
VDVRPCKRAPFPPSTHALKKRWPKKILVCQVIYLFASRNRPPIRMAIADTSPNEPPVSNKKMRIQAHFISKPSISFATPSSFNIPRGVAVVFASIARKDAAGSVHMVIALGQEIAQRPAYQSGLKTLNLPAEKLFVITIYKEATIAHEGGGGTTRGKWYSCRGEAVRNALPSLTTDFCPLFHKGARRLLSYNA